MVSNLPGCGLLVSVVLRAPGAAGRPEGLGVGPEQGLGPEGAEERRIPASSRCRRITPDDSHRPMMHLLHCKIQSKPRGKVCPCCEKPQAGMVLDFCGLEAKYL